MEIIVPRSIVDISQVKLRFSTGLVAQWITRLTTDQKIAGSNPAEIVLLFLQKRMIRFHENASFLQKIIYLS